MKEHYDINQFYGEGLFIFPISMSRIGNSQDPQHYIKYTKKLVPKLKNFQAGCVFVYTNGLYFNTDKKGKEIRSGSNKIIINHKKSFLKKIKKEAEYVPQAFSFLPWDYFMISSDKFPEYYDKLKKLSKEDKVFLKYIKKDLSDKELTDTNIDFIIEEIIIVHFIREKMIDIPQNFIKRENWRLICYPGNYLFSEVYLYQKGILKKGREDLFNKFDFSEYDLENNLLYKFKDVKL